MSRILDVFGALACVFVPYFAIEIIEGFIWLIKQ